MDRSKALLSFSLIRLKVYKKITKNKLNIKKIFKLIDRYYFNNEFFNKLTSDIVWNINLKSNEHSIELVDNKINVNLSPTSLSFLSKLKNVNKIGGILCKNEMMCLILTIEHLFVHLILQVYEYKDYKFHDKMFTCMINELFGHKTNKLPFEKKFHKLLTF